MSASVEIHTRQEPFGQPFTEAEEAIWQAWTSKCRARVRRNERRRITIVKFISIAVMLAAALLGSNIAQVATLIRFAVGIGAVTVMLQAFHAKRYASAALFGALTLLYNPLVPVFGFDGEWQRIAAATSSLPFISSLFWREAGRPDSANLPLLNEEDHA